MSKLRDVGNQQEMVAKDRAEERRIFKELASGMSTAERETLIKKDKLFPSIKYKKEYEDGVERAALFFKKTIRDALPVKPEIPYIPHGTPAEVREGIIRTAQDNYIDMINGYCDLASELRTAEDCAKFPERVQEEGLSTKLSSFRDTRKLQTAISSGKNTDQLIRASQKLYIYPEEKILAQYEVVKCTPESVKKAHDMRHGDYLQIKTGRYIVSKYNVPEELLNRDNWKDDTYFAIGKRNYELLAINSETPEIAQKRVVETIQRSQSKTGNGKTGIAPPQLRHIRDTATNYRDGKNVTQEDLMKDFRLKAVTFGNALNDNERQSHANFCYDAFKDLAKALKVEDEDIGLNGRIGMQYAANGRGGRQAAAAHYSVAPHNINLTRNTGAGCLAHEWGHALDHYIGEQAGQLGELFASESRDGNNPMFEVMRTIKYVDDSYKKTDYYKAAITLDENYAKTGNGYWKSDAELFARAFSCYIEDKLSPAPSDYLCGSSDWYAPTENGDVATMPLGEERQRINAAIDKMIEALKERGILHERIEPEKDVNFTPVEVEDEPAKKRTPSPKPSPAPKREKPQNTPEQEERETRQLTLDDFSSPEPELQKEVDGIKESAETAREIEDLSVGDVIFLEGDIALDRNFNATQLPSTYAKVTEVAEDHLFLDTFKDKEATEFSGKEAFMSVGEHSWKDQLIERGAKLVSKAEPAQEIEKEAEPEKNEPKEQPEEAKSPVPEEPATPPPATEEAKGDTSEMKGTFQHDTNLAMLEETLKNHEPFVAIAISTTGLDSQNFSEHEPIRAAVSRYEYDDSIATYKATQTFDKQVLANDAAIDKAIEARNAPDGYDVFKNAGLDLAEYKTSALGKEEFRQEFTSVMKDFTEDKPLIIENGGGKFMGEYLGKIGCAETLEAMAKENRVIYQTEINKEYLHVNRGSTLEALRNKMNGTEIEGKIIGADNRVAVMAECAIQYGREKGVLENEILSHLMQEDAERKEDYVRRGVEKYQQSDVEKKLDTLVEMKKLNPEAIMERSGDSDINHLYDAMEQNKGVVIMQVATTGFDRSVPAPRSTGEPMQITAAAYSIEDGKINPDKPVDSISFNIQVSEKGGHIAISRAAQGTFDAFKDAKIDRSEYFDGYNNGNTVSTEDAVQKINDFFQKYDDYALVSNGGSKGSEHSFSQVAISNLAQLPMTEKSCIDFQQAVKEYSYQQIHDDNIPENVALNPDSLQNFSLSEIAKSNGVMDVNGTQYKVYFMAQVVSNVAEQHRELTQPEQIHTQEAPVQEQPKETATPEHPSPAPEAPTASEMDNGTPLSTQKQTAPEQPTIASDDIADALNQAASENGKQEELFSDKEEAVAPTITEKAVESPAPQVSEAVQNNTFSGSDVSKLVDVISAQNAMLHEQSQAMMRQSEVLTQMLKSQNEMMRSIIELQSGSREAEKAPVQESASMDISSARTPQEQIVAVQNMIRDIRSEVNAPSGTQIDRDMSTVLSKLTNINMNLGKQAQQAQQAQNKKTPQKGVEQGA